ncbi:hypothetical protein ACFL14_01695 [Patescibacteria group bacterium]
MGGGSAEIEENPGIFLLNSGFNFGSAPRYFTGGISSFQICSEETTDWTVHSSSGIQNFNNETFLNLEVDNPGTWRFEANNDSIEICVLSGASRSHAISDSSIHCDQGEIGVISISLSAHSEAWTESNPIFVIGAGESVLDEVIDPGVSWSRYYPISGPIFRVGIPENQLVHWYWDQDTCAFAEDPTCGEPPIDWGWQPPVPDPPSSGWEPEVPPVDE